MLKKMMIVLAVIVLGMGVAAGVVKHIVDKRIEAVYQTHENAYLDAPAVIAQMIQELASRNPEKHLTVYQNNLSDPQNLELVWEDDFSGKKLNKDNWLYDCGKGIWGNNDLQYYSFGDDLSVNDGVLTIHVTCGKGPNGESEWYSSSKIKTKYRVAVQQGRVEARIKLPSAPGIWPAFWMQGEEGKWPANGEIDIFEAINDCSTVYGSIHWGNSKENHKFKQGKMELSHPEEWHIYAIEWDDQEIRWYVDDECYYTFNYAEDTETKKTFSKPFYLLLNVAVGGDWPGDPDPSAYPKTMYVDYVRVYSTK